MVNNQDATITRTIDGIVQGLYFQIDCQINNFDNYVVALSSPMKMLGLYTLLDNITQTYPNMIRAPYRLPDLIKGDSTATLSNDFLFNSNSFSSSPVGSNTFAKTEPFTINFSDDDVYHYVSVEVEVAYGHHTGIPQQMNHLFTINTHVKLTIAVDLSLTNTV